MKVEILKENFKKEISIIERIVGKNLSLPILDNVLIETDDNFLVMTSTDLETALKVWILTKIIDKGKVAVPVKVLSPFISSLPNEKIIIENEGQNLKIECKSFKTKIQGQNPEDFPLIPKINEEDYIEIDSQLIYNALLGVVDVASLSQTRPEISGIYFSFSKNILKIVSTDSFRLAEKTLSMEKVVKNEYSFILPQKSAKEIIHILENFIGTLKISVSPNQVLMKCLSKDENGEKIMITARIIDGEYPKYQDIIPVKFKTKLTVLKDEFLNQIKTASLFSGKINEVKIIINPSKKEIEVSSKSPDLGENKSTIGAKIEGEPIEISFNYKFLADGLSRIKSSEVFFGVSSQDGPCVLKPVGDNSYLYVVMPIKLT